MEEKKIVTAETIARAKDLVASLERGDEKGSKEVIDDLTNIRESDLYREMGKLTRELHDAIMAFGMDEQISNLAQQEIPDARQRLRHVIDMTDQAAHRTLTAVEESLPICEQLEARSLTLQEDWSRFKKRDMDINEFKQLAKRLDTFFSDNTGDAGKLRSSLNNVLMAQDFQDLTSQIIKKVIKLVEEVESNLVELIKLTRRPDDMSADKHAAEKKQEKLAGPVVPGVNDGGSTVSGQDEVDDLLSSLGF
ncbi:MAG: protein phosphatase CheZ [Gammaproteobacteria bacterium]|nr:protein phosphatase CheZ [Gammaproteobacteria bacterium]